MKPEQLLTQRISNHILMTHYKIPFRFDIGADVRLPIGIAKRLHSLHGKWSRGYPDLFVATVRKNYGGLYLELKATKTVVNSEHTRRQAQYHRVLRNNGYKVDFCCGFEDCVEKIDTYIKLKRWKVK